MCVAERLSFLCIAANLAVLRDPRCRSDSSAAFGAAQRGPENLSPAGSWAISQAHELLDGIACCRVLLPRLVGGYRFILATNGIRSSRSGSAITSTPQS
jgi:hypothetical protein